MMSSHLNKFPNLFNFIYCSFLIDFIFFQIQIHLFLSTFPHLLTNFELFNIINNYHFLLDNEINLILIIYWIIFICIN